MSGATTLLLKKSVNSRNRAREMPCIGLGIGHSSAASYLQRSMIQGMLSEKCLNEFYGRITEETFDRSELKIYLFRIFDPVQDDLLTLLST